MCKSVLIGNVLFCASKPLKSPCRGLFCVALQAELCGFYSDIDVFLDCFVETATLSWCDGNKICSLRTKNEVVFMVGCFVSD